MENKIFNYTISHKGLELPLSISFVNLNRGPLKAIVSINYAGVFLKNIRILEDRFGNISVNYPTRDFVDKQGEEKQAQVYYPSRDLTVALNRLITSSYTNFLIDGQEMFKMVEETMVEPKKAKRPSKKSASKPKVTEAKEEETATAEPEKEEQPETEN